MKSALTDVGAEEAVKRLYRLTGNKDLRFVQVSLQEEKNEYAFTHVDICYRKLIIFDQNSALFYLGFKILTCFKCLQIACYF